MTVKGNTKLRVSFLSEGGKLIAVLQGVCSIVDDARCLITDLRADWLEVTQSGKDIRMEYSRTARKAVLSFLNERLSPYGCEAVEVA